MDLILPSMLLFLCRIEFAINLILRGFQTIGSYHAPAAQGIPVPEPVNGVNGTNGVNVRVN